MKKILLSFLTMLSLFTLVGCATVDSKKFKEDYEKLNGQFNSKNKEHRTINIPEDNPFVYSTAEDIVKKIENKETFYVYFGDDLCPWCRSVIESAIKIAKNNKINTIYYVPIWDDDGKEVIRDKKELKNSEIVTTIKGTDAYYKLLDYFKDFLRDYTIGSDNDTINTNEKRIYAPNFMYIEKGEIKKLTSGKSSKQKDSRDPLTDEIISDEENQFQEFFKK